MTPSFDLVAMQPRRPDMRQSALAAYPEHPAASENNRCIFKFYINLIVSFVSSALSGNEVTPKRVCIYRFTEQAVNELSVERGRSADAGDLRRLWYKRRLLAGQSSSMRVDLFDFELPAERIAQRPVHPRDASRLLSVTPSSLADHWVTDLPSLLRAGDLLVFNDTKVIPARLIGHRGEARVSITLHQMLGPDLWRVFAKPAKRLRPDDQLIFTPDFSAKVIERGPLGDIVLRFDRGGVELMTALHAYGTIPLPPYIRGGAADGRDDHDYQTIFARHEGAVAAPTAALHFSLMLLDGLARKGVTSTKLTLHVGAGTFLPVKADDTDDHVMHEEIGVLSAETAEKINATRRAGGRIVAVGTTSMRLLETATGEDRIVQPFAGSTSIFITPGYRFKAVDLLMTNFHLPRSTLFMLVSAFAGLERMKSAYEHAIAAGYRFYSYGDACLLEPARD